MKTTNIRKIALKQLQMSPKNVRKAETTDQDDSMIEASIAAHGLKQNLGVEVGADDEFLVVYGGRRFRALKRLCEKGVIDGEYKVPCTLIDEADAEEASIAENVARVAMHPADEFDAFAKLIEAGNSERDVADRFGVPVAHVQKRMKLSRVAPEIVDLYRQRAITLDILQAFAICDSHERQLETLEQTRHFLNSQGGNPAQTVRRALLNHAVSAGSRLAAFVGLEAYEAAGGRITRDLFSQDAECHLDDPSLLNTLAISKLEEEKTKLESEWRWVTAMMDMPYDLLRAYGRIYPELKYADDDLVIVGEIETIDARITELEELEDLTDEVHEEWRSLNERRDELEGSLQEPCHVYSAEARAIAGAIVTVDHDGDLKVEAGIVKPEDIPAPQPKVDERQETKTEAEDDENAQPATATDHQPDAAEAEELSSSTPLHIERPANERFGYNDRMVAAPQTVALKEAGLSAALGDDLRAIRLQAMKAHLQVDFDVSFDLMVYSMCQETFRTSYNPTPLDLKLTRAMNVGSRTHLEGTVAERMIEKCKASLSLGWMNLPKPDDFKALSALHFEEKQALFAFASSTALKQQLAFDHGADPVIEEAGRRLDIDLASIWRPTADNYFKRVTKDSMLGAARETISEAWSAEHRGMKKGAIAEVMENAFSEDGRTRAGLAPEEAARTARWLPEGMTFASGTEEAPIATAEEGMEDSDNVVTIDDQEDEDDKEEASDDEEEQLPAFLTEAA